MLSRRKHIALFLNAWSAAALLFFAGVMLYSSAGRDDVFKTLFPAWTLSEFGQILNYNGDTIEQSSSLLQVLLIGFFHKILGGNTVQLGSLLAVLCGMATVMYSPLVAQAMGLSVRSSKRVPWLIATSSFVTYWAWGGLDASLAALCLLLTVDSLQRFLKGGRPWYFLGAGLAFVLVRPENGLVGLLGLSLLGLYAWRTHCADFPWRRVAVALGMLMAIGLAVAAWRWWYFGSIVPLPVRAKASGLEFARAYRGATYFFWSMWRHPEFAALLLTAAVALWQLIRRKAAGPFLLLLSMVLAVGSFVLLSGGDWMENGRFLVPMVPLLGILVMAGIENSQPKWLTYLPLAVLFLGGWGLLQTARNHSTGKPLWATIQELPTYPGFSYAETGNRIHARDVGMCVRLDDLLANWPVDEANDIRILSQQAGMVIFHTARKHYKKIQFIDLVGLSTPDFLDCPVTRDRGAYRGGLNMDIYYLLEDLPRLKEQCGFTLPEIIFDLDNERHEKENFLADRGYTLLYRREGWVTTDKPAFPGLLIGAWQILMVRDDIVPKFQEKPNADAAPTILK